MTVHNDEGRPLALQKSVRQAYELLGKDPSPMMSLTHKQKRVHDAIARLWDQEGRPPTTRELASGLACHPKTVHKYLSALERKGAIERRKGSIHLASGLRLREGVPVAQQADAAGRVSPSPAADHKVDPDRTMRKRWGRLVAMNAELGADFA